MSKTSYTKVELPTVSAIGAITIKPYFEESENMGLEKYGLSLFDGVYHEEPVTCLEANGVKRYITGLNPFAPEVKAIKNDQEREAKIKQIHTVVAQLEAELAHNIIKPDDPEFWNKVTLLRPDNHEFWSKVTIRCGNQPVYLNPATNAHDLIRLYAIEAGGFSIVAKSYEDAKKRARAPKFYLDKTEDTVAIKTELKKVRNEALSELNNLFKKSSTKLRYIAKVLDANSTLYKKSTPADVIYDNMDKFILGEGIEKSSKRASELFLATAELDIETLKLKALLKDAVFYRLVVTKSDGKMYHHKTQSMMGGNLAECVEYLKAPVNDNILGDLMSDVEPYWNS